MLCPCLCMLQQDYFCTYISERDDFRIIFMLLQWFTASRYRIYQPYQIFYFPFVLLLIFLCLVHSNSWYSFKFKGSIFFTELSGKIWMNIKKTTKKYNFIDFDLFWILLRIAFLFNLLAIFLHNFFTIIITKNYK